MKNWLLLLLLSLVGLLSGIFIVDEREVVLLSHSPTDTKLYHSGIYWHLPFYSDLVYVYINHRTTALTLAPARGDMPSAKIFASPYIVRLVLDWQVVDPIKYVNYLNLNSLKGLDQALVSALVALLSQQVTTQADRNAIAKSLHLPHLGLNLTELGIKVNSIMPTEISLASSSLSSESEVAAKLAVESAYQLAIQIKQAAITYQQEEYKSLAKRNQKFFDYLLKINAYQLKATSKAQVPPFSQF